VNKYMVKRLDREEYEPRRIYAATPDLAALTLIEEDEQGHVEFPIASGHESAIVEVDGHGRFEVCGDPSPHYFTRRR